MDPQNQPCISYHDDPNGALKMACRVTSGGWTTFDVTDPETPVGDYSSLAIGPDGSFHISYRRGTINLSVLKYAHSYDANGWTIETVDTHAQGVGHNTSIALDSEGSPHIAHRKRFGKQAVKYAQSMGSTWETTTVMSAGGSDYYFGDTSLVLDSDDRPFLAFLGLGDDAGLDLARKAGRKWKISRVASFYAGDSVSMVLEESLDGTGTFHIVYSTGGYPDEQYEMKYVYGSKTADGSLGGDWNIQTEPIDKWIGNDAGFDFASLAIDPGSGDLHLSYYDYRLGVLKYAFKEKDGSWSSPTEVDRSGDVGLYSSIALGLGGTPNIAYYDAANGDLRYAIYSPTCLADGDCGDDNPCTTDSCQEGTCLNANNPGGCTLGGVSGLCCEGTCALPICDLDADCIEYDADTCVATDTCANTCEAWCVDGDGFCPTQCSLSGDQDCPACDIWDNRKDCNADTRCKWSNQSKYCYLR